jgi:hypothetical protein
MKLGRTDMIDHMKVVFIDMLVLQFFTYVLLENSGQQRDTDSRVSYMTSVKSRL